MEKVQNTFNQLRNLLYQQDENLLNQLEKIEQTLNQLNIDVGWIEEVNYDMFAYISYFIAVSKMKYLNLDQNEQQNCEDDKQTYQEQALDIIDQKFSELEQLVSQYSLDDKLVQEHLEKLEYEIQIIKEDHEDKFKFYQQIILDKKNSGNKSQKIEEALDNLNQLVKEHSFNNQEILLQIQNALNQLEQDVKSIKEVDKFGYYSFIIAFYRKKYLKSDKQQTTIWENEMKKYKEFVIQCIESNFQKLNQFTQDTTQIQYVQKFQERLQSQLKLISNIDKQLFGYYKYLITKSKLNNFQLDQKNKEICQKKLKNFKRYYDKQIQKKQNEEIVQDENVNDKQEIQNQELISQNQRIINEELNQRKYYKKKYLVVGETGVGKSSFVRYLTNDSSVQTSNGENSHTQECREFKYKNLNLIDTPGLNDTKRNRYEILFIIVKYLSKNKIKLEQLFIICVSQRDISNHKNNLQELAYAFFLYELFGDSISVNDMEELIEQIKLSRSFLNWQEIEYHKYEDKKTEQRILMFENKDKALNYYEYLQNLHIVVRSKFDTNSQEDLKEFNYYSTIFMKEQIWVNLKQKHQNLGAYQEYIKEQEIHLFDKIYKIIDLQEEISVFQTEDLFYYILLIGESQVGKSSLIEQLKNISGLRGSGKQSETSCCQMYLIQKNNVKYYFIDTPGFNGTENNQDQLHNLKVIADFLRRSRINQFKILYMRDADKEIRNQMYFIIVKLFIFIDEMFDKNPYFIDSELKNLLSFGATTNKENETFFKKNILTIERVKKRKHSNQVYSNTFGNKSIEFKNNYITKMMRFIQVDQKEDFEQQATLFQAINEIEIIYLEQKILSQIKKIVNSKIIDNVQLYKQSYERVLNLYKEYFEILEQINSNIQKNRSNAQDLVNEKVRILKDLDSIIYIVIQDFDKSQEMLLYFQSKFPKTNNQNNHQNQINDQMQNSIRKHFIKIKYFPILFESESNLSNLLLSRKQLFFMQVQHQLKPFLQQNNPNHQNILEDLALFKIIQELTFLYHTQSKIIEKSQQLTPQEIDNNLECIFQKLNSALCTEACLNRYISFFTCKETLDALDLNFRGIIDDNLSNQILLRFQRSYFLSELKITHSSQIQLKEAQNNFINLKKENFNNNTDQKNFFLKLFKNCKENELKDVISQHIVKNILSKQFQFQFQQIEGQDQEQYLKQIEYQISQNQIIIDTFYVSFKKNDKLELLQVQKKSLTKALIKAKEKLKTSNNENKDSFQKKNVNLIDGQLKENLIGYQKLLSKFIDHIQTTPYNYKEQVKFGYSFFRQSDPFSNLFYGYCNLVYMKSQYIYKQDTISEIQKNNNQFQVRPQCNFQNTLSKYKNDQQLILNLNNLTLFENFSSSRYLQKLQGQKEPNFSSYPENQILYASVEYSIDLYEIAIKSRDFLHFIKLTQNEIKNELKMNNDIYERFNHFYRSIDPLKNLFF